MKRLLTYLFLVLGLTILFQTKLYAPVIILEGDYCVVKKVSWIGHVVTKMKENSICDDIIVNPNKHHNFYSFLTGHDKGTGVFHVPKILIGPYLALHKKQTQIAKKEPKKKEKKVVKKEKKETDSEIFWGTVYAKAEFKHNRDIPPNKGCAIAKEEAINKALTKYPLVQGEVISTTKMDLKKSVTKSESGANIFICEADIGLYVKYTKSKLKKVAKKEPKKKPKKKVAKVVEQEQEEFKPKEKDIDNDPPVIQIAEAITVDSQSYTLKGKVKDKSKQIYLTIDGRPVEVKRGKFTLDRFNYDPEIVEEIKIVAIDKWNNKSEKIVKVTVKLKATEVVRAYEELKPNKVKVSKDKNKIAIIIGVEKYKNMTECNYCNRDAKAFKAYATRALGVLPSNIISLVGSKATRGEILRAFKISLPRIAGDGGKDINIFFAGHGLASESGEELYIIPQDGDESLLEDTAISRVELIKLIKKVDPKSVTMFFDTCYSGQTRGEQMLVASLRGIRIVEAEGIPDNFSIFTASSSNQGSSHIEEAKHGMFSYYLMKGLEGKADGNKDKQITNGELIAYLKTNVGKEAFTQNREQDPMLSGDPDQVLMRY